MWQDDLAARVESPDAKMDALEGAEPVEVAVLRSAGPPQLLRSAHQFQGAPVLPSLRRVVESTCPRGGVPTERRLFGRWGGIPCAA